MQIGLGLGLTYPRYSSGGGSPAPSTVSLDASINTATLANTYHAFGFDRMVQGYSGNSVRLKRLSDNGEQDFGFDANGFFDISGVNTWRSSADVDVVSFYDQTGNGATSVNDNTLAFIRSDIPYRFGCDYEQSEGAELSVTNITQANPAVVTSAGHGLSTGDVVYIGTVVGMTEINGGFHAVTVLTTDTLELDGVDSTSFTAYSSGGYIQERKRELLTRSTTEGGYGCDLAGVGALKITGTTVDLSGSGLEIHMLNSLNTRKTTSPSTDQWGGNNDVEWIMTYGEQSNYFRNRFYSAFGTYGRLFTTGGATDNDNGGTVAIHKQYAQNLWGMHLDDTDYKTSIIGRDDVSRSVNAANATNINAGQMDDLGLLIGAQYTAGDEPHANNRGDFVFGGVVICKTLTANERFNVRAKMNAMGQQHRLKSKDDVLAVWDEVVFHKDVNPTTGLLAGSKGKLSLQYNAGTNAHGTHTTDFSYTDPVSGLQGIRFPDQNQANGFRATDTYFTDAEGVGTMFALHVADIPSLTLAYVFTQDTTDGFSGDKTNRSMALGRDHSDASFWAQVATPRQGAIVGTSSRVFSDLTGVGDQLGDQEQVKYARNTALDAVKLATGTILGYSQWSFDSLANRDPNAPKTFQAPVDIPLAQNNGLMQYNGFLALQVATFEKPVGYNFADDAATREATMLYATNKHYVAETGQVIGHITGDISINTHASVVDPDATARIVSSHWSDNYEGTTHAIGFLPGTALTQAQVEELHVNMYKLFE